MDSRENLNVVVSLGEISNNLVEKDVLGKSVVGRHGKPLRLYTNQGKPVTDFDGVPLQNIVGKSLLCFNKKSLELNDLSGLPLRDCRGRLPSNIHYNPEKSKYPHHCLDPLLDANGKPRLFYDLNGYPLTDKKGRILLNNLGECLMKFDYRTEHLCDLEGHQIIEDYEYELTSQKILCNNSGTPIYLYDAFKRPLTTVEGVPLLDIMGVPLVIANQSQCLIIKAQYGSDVYDSKGRCSSNPNFDPVRKSSSWKLLPPYQDLNGKPILVFDRTGFPLSDSFGIPLIDSNGNALIKFDRKRGLVSNTESEVIQISLTCYDPKNLRSVCSKSGTPARLFNFQGCPLTNWLGEPLKHADGSIMLKFGYDGCPKSDFQGLPIYDEYGTSIQENSFMPYDVYPMDKEFPREIDESNRGIKLFDGSGMPLTDHRGFHLTNASRNFMIKRNQSNIPVSDLKGGSLFTECGLPLVRCLEAPLLGPKGKACQLFDNRGYPLLCKKGIPLKFPNGRCAINIDKIGRIIGDSKGETLYDSNGFSMSFCTKFNPTRSSKFGCSKETISNRINKLRLTSDDRQLKDSKKTFRSDLFNNCLKKSSNSKSFFNDNNRRIIRKTEFEMCSNNDCNGSHVEFIVSNMSKSGESDCRKVLKHFSGSVNFNSYLNHKVQSLRQIVYQGCSPLFDYKSFPILDQSKSILETSTGESVMKVDNDGITESDYREFDNYDNKGLSLTNTSGFWKNKRGIPLRLFNKFGMPLTDSKGNTLHDIKGHPLLGRDEIGRPSLDFNNQTIFDSCSVPSTCEDEQFCPVEKLNCCGSLVPLLDLNEKPLRVYNADGWPLNDETGLPLINGKFDVLLSVDKGLECITDIDGNTVFDKNEIPLGCKLDSPLITMNGKPFRLFNKKGQPLTDFSGMPLKFAKFANKLCVIVFDMFGRPIQDTEGEGLYDSKGNVQGNFRFRPDEATSFPKNRIQAEDGSPLKLFDHDGWPMTDSNGFVLCCSKGQSFINFDKGVFLSTKDGGRLYDDSGKEYIPKNLIKN